jgi:NADH-quinone oxidoreductase subunit J
LVFGALLAVTSARLIRSVCGLAVCCFGLAGLYYFLHSPFLALMEILIYVGAVCVTIVFAVMLAEPDEPGRTETSGSTLVWGGLAFTTAGCLFGGLFWLGYRGNWSAPVGPVSDGSIAAIGRALLTTYSMAFELISLALLVAILGALAIARAGRTRPGPMTPDEVVSSKFVTKPQPAVAGTEGALDHNQVVSCSRDLVAS